MPEMPVTINGVTRLVWVESLDEDNWRAAEHQYRRESAMQRRKYFEGTQYEAENLEALEKLYPECSPSELLWKRLPEHQRKHAYSSQIAVGVQFLADEIASSLVLEPDDESVKTWLDAFMKQSRLDYRWEEVIQDVLITGDVAARLIPVASALDDESAVRVEFWRSEDIEIDYAEDDWQQMVEVRFEEYRNEVNANGENREVRYVHAFRMRPFVDAEGEFREEAVELIFGEESDDPIETRRLGLPFLPWVHISAERNELRSMYGKSVITPAVMESADRYNATCQLQYLAVRFNSFANLAVTGDATHLAVNEGKMIRKDIADVLSFPGGTSVSSVTLPIDTEAIEAHKKTLSTSIFDGLGVTELTTETVTGLGGLSGYALEILNRKNNGTFQRIKENIRKALMRLMNLALDVDAIVRNAVFDEFGDRHWWEVDPEEVWPNREMRIAFGSSYIVDDAKIERQYGLSMISRREALRQSGFDDEQIEQIEDEIEEEGAQADSRISMQIRSGNGSRLADTSATRGA